MNQSTNRLCRAPAVPSVSVTSSSGFAVVIALALMSFVLLLLLSVTTLTQVNIRGAVNQQQLLSARENAKLGVLIGLGDLQKYLGPDQRVSARAEISDGSENPYWTGVWDSRNDTRLAWLVSGESPDDQVDYSATTDHEELLPPSPVTGNGSVAVPVVSIQGSSQSTGHYAYWIEDESVKAKANLANSVKDSSDAQELRTAVTIAPRFGLTAVSDLEGLELDLANLDKASNAEQYRLLQAASMAPDSDVWQERFHDLTVHSFGVLSDTKNGGLKRDLTAAFSDSTEFGELINFHSSGDQIFGPANGASATVLDPGGPLWEQMRSYYNLHASAGGSVAVRPQTNSEAGVYPIVTAAQQYFGISKDGNSINVHYMPAVTLWNPYNVALESSDYTVVIGRSAGKPVPSWSYIQFGRVSIVIYDPSGAGTAIDLYPGPYVYNIKGIRLEPGETKVFSPPSGHQPVSFSSTGRDVNNVVYKELNFTPPTLEPGLRIQDSSFYDTIPWTTPWVNFRPVVAPSRNASFGLFQGSAPQIHDNLPLQSSNFLLLNSMSNYRGYDVVGPLNSPAADASSVFATNQLFGLRYRMNFVSNNEHISDRRYDNIPWLKHYNPRASNSGISPFEFLDETSARINPNFDASLDLQQFRSNIQTDFDNGFAGYSLSGNGSLDARLFEITGNTDELISLGQFAQAPLFYTGVANGSDAQQVHVQSMARGNFDNLIPAFALGNSVADPRIPLNQTALNWATDVTGATSYGFNDFDGTHYDYSWLLNDALWDAYFLSTVPQTGAIEEALTNPRLQLSQSAAFYNDPSHSVELQSLRSFNEVSAHLMIDGPFNVNSTSVEAWAALLASFLDVSVPVDGSATTYDMAVDKAAMTRFAANTNSPLSTGADNYLDESAYHGFRVLTKAEIRKLASEIVTEVKLRGPFMTLSDFVNRSLTVDELGIKGALQAAIDRSGINGAFESSDVDLDPYDLIFDQTRPNASFHALEASPGSSGINATITQADLMTKFGPVFTPRGDTFVIRAMGTSSSSVSADSGPRVYCEAVVQRFPEFVESGDAASVFPPVSDLNTKFGRQFKIISFRWVAENEI